MKHSIPLGDVYAVTDFNGENRSVKTRIGIALINRSERFGFADRERPGVRGAEVRAPRFDDSISVVLDALPMNGRLLLVNRSNKRKTTNNLKEVS